MAMELSPNMGAGSKQFGTNYGVFSGLLDAKNCNFCEG